MSVTQYIGARYVPIFAEPAEWSSERSYEPLTIVLYQGASYTSRQAVPIGIDIENTDFWSLTGNYNAQVEAYRQEVRQFDSRISDNSAKVENLEDQMVVVNESLESLDTRMEEAESDIIGLQDAMVGLRTYNVVDSAYMGMNMSFYGAIEFNDNPYGDIHDSATKVDYIGGACVLGNILYTYSDAGDFSKNGVFRRYNMSTGEYIGRTNATMNTHNNGMSAYDGKVYVCGSKTNYGNTFMFVHNSSLGFEREVPLGRLIYAVAKTVDPTEEKGMFVGFDRTDVTNPLIVHFNMLDNGIEVVKEIPVHMPKMTNGITLAKDDTLLCINTINAMSVVVFDVETGATVGECAIGTEDSPCELEDSVWWFDPEKQTWDYYGIFSVNEQKHAKRTSETMGVAKIRLFSDQAIDSDSAGSWLSVNGYNRIWCSHPTNANNFKATGSANDPLMSLTFAIAMFAHSNAAIDVTCVGASKFFHFPLINGSNNVYIHKQSGATTEINDCVFMSYGAYLALYADSITEHFRFINASYEGTVIQCTNAFLAANVTTFDPTATWGIRAYYSQVNISSQVSMPGLNLDNTYLLSKNNNSVFGENLDIDNSVFKGVNLFGSDTALGNFFANASGTLQIVAKIENVNNSSDWFNVVLCNNSGNIGTFTGASYGFNGAGLSGVRLFRSASGGYTLNVENSTSNTYKLVSARGA